MSLRKCRLNARKAKARVIPMIARQVMLRKAAGSMVTTRSLHTGLSMGTWPPCHKRGLQSGHVKSMLSKDG